MVRLTETCPETAGASVRFVPAGEKGLSHVLSRAVRSAQVPWITWCICRSRCTPAVTGTPGSRCGKPAIAAPRRAPSRRRARRAPRPARARPRRCRPRRARPRARASPPPPRGRLEVHSARRAGPPARPCARASARSRWRARGRRARAQPRQSATAAPPGAPAAKCARCSRARSRRARRRRARRRARPRSRRGRARARGAAASSRPRSSWPTGTRAAHEPAHDLGAAVARGPVDRAAVGPRGTRRRPPAPPGGPVARSSAASSPRSSTRYLRGEGGPQLHPRRERAVSSTRYLRGEGGPQLHPRRERAALVDEVPERRRASASSPTGARRLVDEAPHDAELARARRPRERAVPRAQRVRRGSCSPRATSARSAARSPRPRPRCPAAAAAAAARRAAASAAPSARRARAARRRRVRAGDARGDALGRVERGARDVVRRAVLALQVAAQAARALEEAATRRAVALAARGERGRVAAS